MLKAELTEIEVCDLVVFAHHGVWPEEKTLGQKFILTLSVLADLEDAIAGDDYTQAVCYGELCRIAEDVTKARALDLIETLAARIGEEVLAQCPRVQQVRVTVAKPSAPLAYALSTVKVSVTRKRVHSFGLGLGGNLGEVEGTLRLALERLARVPGLEIDAVSSFYDSAPWGVEDQPPFVNCAALGRTTLSPEALLNVCKDTEDALGRAPNRRWGERLVDVDVLFYGDTNCNTPTLTLPHRHLFERAFVLEPLVELAPDLQLQGHSVREALQALSRTPGDVVRRSPCQQGTGRG